MVRSLWRRMERREMEGDEGKGKMEDMKEKMRQLRVASGTTQGEAEMLVSFAPLVFSALDGITAEEASGFKAKLKSTSKFVANYFEHEPYM